MQWPCRTPPHLMAQVHDSCAARMKQQLTRAYTLARRLLALSMSTTRYVAYIRKSSATHLGESKRLEKCRAYDCAKNMNLVTKFRDPAVSRTDPLVAQCGFAEMIDYCQKAKLRIRTIFVECRDRFAQDSVVQETGLKWLGELGLTILCTDNDVQSSNPSITCAFLRQMLGAINDCVQTDAGAVVSWVSESAARSCK